MDINNDRKRNTWVGRHFQIICKITFWSPPGLAAPAESRAKAWWVIFPPRETMVRMCVQNGCRVLKKPGCMQNCCNNLNSNCTYAEPLFISVVFWNEMARLCLYSPVMSSSLLPGSCAVASEVFWVIWKIPPSFPSPRVVLIQSMPFLSSRHEGNLPPHSISVPAYCLLLAELPLLSKLCEVSQTPTNNLIKLFWCWRPCGSAFSWQTGVRIAGWKAKMN